MLFEGGHFLCPGEETRFFSEIGLAERWLSDNFFILGSYPESEDQKRASWHHRDSMPESYVLAELREVPLDDADESKFKYLADFP